MVFRFVFSGVVYQLDNVDTMVSALGRHYPQVNEAVTVRRLLAEYIAATPSKVAKAALITLDSYIKSLDADKAAHDPLCATSHEAVGYGNRSWGELPSAKRNREKKRRKRAKASAALYVEPLFAELDLAQSAVLCNLGSLMTLQGHADKLREAGPDIPVNLLGNVLWEIHNVQRTLRDAQRHRDAIKKRIREVLATGQFVRAPTIRNDFIRRLCQYS